MQRITKSRSENSFTDERMRNTTTAITEVIHHDDHGVSQFTCPMCRSDMVVPTRIERHEVWYCPKCGFMDIEGGGMYYEEAINVALIQGRHEIVWQDAW